MSQNNWVHKLAIANLKANGRRNLLIMISVAVMTMVVATTLNIAVSMVSSSEKENRDKIGTLADYRVNNPTIEQIGKLKELKYIKNVGSEIVLGKAFYNQFEMQMIYVDDEEWTQNREGTYTNFEGNLPTAKNEIIVPEVLLQSFGIKKPYIGKEIAFKCFLKAKKSAEMTNPSEMTFRIVGYFDDQRQYDTKKQGIIYGSEELAAQYGKSVNGDGSVYFSKRKNALLEEFRVLFKILDLPFTGSNGQRIKADLQKELHLKPNQQIKVLYNDPSYIYDAFEDIKTYLIIILPVMICGFLLIYDCFYLSVSKDIRTSGILLAVGATQKQLKSIMNRQAEILALIGMAVGILLSVIASFYAVPMYLRIVYITQIRVYCEWSVAAYLLSVIVIFIIVIASAQTVNLYVSKISIIESIQFEKIVTKKSPNNLIKRICKCKIKPYPTNRGIYRMAALNVLQTFRTNVHVILSLFIAVTVFLFINVIVGGISPEDFAIYRLENHDFVLENDSFSSEYSNGIDSYGSNTEQPIFDDDFIKELENQEGITNINIVGYVPVAVKIDLNVLGKYIANHFAIHGGYTEYQQGAYEEGSLWVIDTDYLQEHLTGNEVNIKDFESGKIALAESDRPDLFPKNFSIEGYYLKNHLNSNALQMNPSTDEETFSYKIGGFFPPERAYGVALTSVPPCIYVADSVIKKTNIKPIIFRIEIDADKANRISLESYLKDKAESNSLIWFESREQLIETMKASQNAAYILGYVLSAVVALIGVLGFINMTTINIDSRKSEFAVLRSIGMSKKQLLRMLLVEGLYYSLILITLIVTLGNFIIFKLYPLFKAEYETFTYPMIPLISWIVIITAIMEIIPIMAYSPENQKSISKALQES